MKTFCFIFISYLAWTRSSTSALSNEKSHIGVQKKKVVAYQIRYGHSAFVDSSFFEGYSIVQKKILDRKTGNSLMKLLNDSSNYYFDKSKNCVLAASYGIKISGDSSEHLLYIGKNPCLKITDTEKKSHTEKTTDLTEHNTVIPFLDSLFGRKG